MSDSVAYCFVARHFIPRQTKMTYLKTFFCFRTDFRKNVLSECTFAFALVIFFSECAANEYKIVRFIKIVGSNVGVQLKPADKSLTMCHMNTQSLTFTLTIFHNGLCLKNGTTCSRSELASNNPPFQFEHSHQIILLLYIFIIAKSIARQIGLISQFSRTVEDIAEERKCRLLDVHPSDATAIVIDGIQLKKLSLKELEKLMCTYGEIIFARTSPLQTFTVVLSCQKTGSMVAVAGSGMNDLIALKKADLGVALGIRGTDLTKEMADIVLLDDSLATLVNAIEEGRLLYDNIKKATAFTITSTVPELLPFIVHVLLGIPLAFGIIAILIIDLVTNIWPAISLAYEKEEYNLMKRPPNPIGTSIVSNQMCFTAPSQIGMLETFAGFFAYFAVMIEHGWLPLRLMEIRQEWNLKWVNDLKDSYGQEWTYEGRTRLAYTCQACFCITIIALQWGNAIVSKTMIKSVIQTSSNWVMNCSLVFETILVLALVFIPSKRDFYFEYANKPSWLAAPICYLILIIVYGEIRKGVFRSRKYQWFFRESCY